MDKQEGFKMLTIIEDVNNKIGKHDLKNKWWSEQGVKVWRYRLPVGDYIIRNEMVQDVIERKAKRGVPVKMMDLLGTYKVCVDSKFGLQELIGDFQKDHERFRDELLLAKNNGIKLYIVVENDFQWISQRKNIYNTPVKEIKDLFRWKNPRAFIFKEGKQAYPNCAKGSWLAKCCMTVEEKYGCKFVFCKPDEAAEVIIKILQGGDLGGILQEHTNDILDGH